MKKNGKAREYKMKGGDTPRADLRPILVDAVIQKDTIDIIPVMNFAPVMKGVARTYKKRASTTKKRKNRK